MENSPIFRYEKKREYNRSIVEITPNDLGYDWDDSKSGNNGKMLLTWKEENIIEYNGKLYMIHRIKFEEPGLGRYLYNESIEALPNDYKIPEVNEEKKEEGVEEKVYVFSREDNFSYPYGIKLSKEVEKNVELAELYEYYKNKQIEKEGELYEKRKEYEELVKGGYIETCLTNVYKAKHDDFKELMGSSEDISSYRIERYLCSLKVIEALARGESFDKVAEIYKENEENENCPASMGIIVHYAKNGPEFIEEKGEELLGYEMDKNSKKVVRQAKKENKALAKLEGEPTTEREGKEQGILRKFLTKMGLSKKIDRADKELERLQDKNNDHEDIEN